MLKKKGKMRVTITRIDDHKFEQSNLVTVMISDRCPKCGKKRGKPGPAVIRGNGKILVGLTAWENPCGHVDSYADVREEAGIINIPEGRIRVTIPRTAQHAGYDGNLLTVDISDKCPKCGAKRAVKRWKGLSYDGSMRLQVDCWDNECGHVDKYSDVIQEIIKEVQG